VVTMISVRTSMTFRRRWVVTVWKIELLVIVNSEFTTIQSEVGSGGVVGRGVTGAADVVPRVTFSVVSLDAVVVTVVVGTVVVAVVVAIVIAVVVEAVVVGLLVVKEQSGCLAEFSASSKDMACVA
jgi:hypothetical protein